MSVQPSQCRVDAKASSSCSKLQSPINALPPASLSSTPATVNVTRPTKCSSTLHHRHLSPRQFRQAAAASSLILTPSQMASMPLLSPISPQRRRHFRHQRNSFPASTPVVTSPALASCPAKSMTPPQSASIPWNLSWLYPVPMASTTLLTNLDVGIGKVAYGNVFLDKWLQEYEQDVLLYESLAAFAQVKLPEALALCGKIETLQQQQQQEEQIASAPTDAGAGDGVEDGVEDESAAEKNKTTRLASLVRASVRLKVAVLANLLDRTVVAMSKSKGLEAFGPLLFQARDELFRLVFCDYDGDSNQLAGNDENDQEDDDSDDEKKREPEAAVRKAQGRDEELQRAFAAGQMSRMNGTVMEADDGEEEEDADEGDEHEKQNDSQDARAEEEGELKGVSVGIRVSRPSGQLNSMNQPPVHDSLSSPSSSGPLLQQQQAEQVDQELKQHQQQQPRHVFPRTLGFFLSKTPFASRLTDSNRERDVRFKQKEVVLRRIIQSMHRSLGSVFHAWRTYVHNRKEEEINRKGAQLTAMIVLQRGLLRAVFMAWNKLAVENKIRQLRAKELAQQQAHEETLEEFQKQLFLLQEANYKLQVRVEELERECIAGYNQMPFSHPVPEE